MWQFNGGYESEEIKIYLRIFIFRYGKVYLLNQIDMI